MSLQHGLRMLATSSLALILLACGGGGGGGGPGSVPTPPAPPSPPPLAPAGAWNDKSASRTFDTLGYGTTFNRNTSSATVTGGTADSAISVRYSATDAAYYVTLPGQAETRLVEDGTAIYSDKTYAGFFTYNFRSQTGSTEQFTTGIAAFGTGTAGAAVPVTGSATYAGSFYSVSDRAFVRESENFITDVYAFGPVTMNVNFASGTLSGQIVPTVACMNCFETTLAAILFNGTLSSAGSNGFSGTFVASAPGPNEITGLFVGPAAQEAIARFRVPVKDVFANGDSYVLSGAWIVKK